MLIKIVLSALVTGLSLLLCSPANACSVMASYYVPANYDLVGMADAIVIATPRQRRNWHIGSAPEGVQFEIVQVIAGQNVTEAVNVYGARCADTELVNAHSESFSGACNRYRFPTERLYILFLNETPDGWRAISAPFARTHEDIPGPDSLWVWAIEQYLSVVALPDDQSRYEALIDLRDNNPGGPIEWHQALTQDIENYLALGTSRKTLQFIEAQLSDENASPRSISGALLSLLAGEHNDPARYFEAYLTNPPPLNLIGALTRYYEETGNHEAFATMIQTRLTEITEFGSSNTAYSVSYAVRRFRNELPIELIVEAHWAYRLSRFHPSVSFRDMQELLRPYADVSPPENPALSVLLAGHDFEEPVRWAEQVLDRTANEHTDLAIRIIADSSRFQNGGHYARRIACSTGPLRLRLINENSESTTFSRMALILQIWNLGNTSPAERAAIRLSLLEQALSEGDDARFFPDHEDQIDVSERNLSNRAWVALQTINAGEPAPVTTPEDWCSDAPTD
jgi:hypothetical protein